ncbi:MAG: Release factor glutamine methyltransferase [Syntrophorhabdus sp. PtaU1.Bin002]|nr:MAG: Release factor glutamine methyltransferase [Syntrophorhabdus sp. PtaB.Bin006]OPY69267.1 MAG: Release factor glutamine methyltransferase [Syntrophorhabdus sp. PtaU1.Bin002]
MKILDIMTKQEGVDRLDMVNVLAFVLAVRQEEVLMNLDRSLDEETAHRVSALLKERSQGKPLAYITKRKEFFSESFFVDERVLIPRPDTETLVEGALEILNKKPNMKCILDMGAGSGAIGLIIAKKTGKRIVCVDVSQKALTVAEKNSRDLGVRDKVDFLCSDLFGGTRREKKFDMIVANLPYVAQTEWDSLMRDVKAHEPRTALDGGADGAEVYRRFVQELPHYLKTGGCVLCEIGGAGRAEQVREMLRAAGFLVVTKRDLSGNERVLIGSWTSLS